MAEHYISRKDFSPFSDDDWFAFAGAECYTDPETKKTLPPLIAYPDKRTIIIVDANGVSIYHTDEEDDIEWTMSFTADYYRAKFVARMLSNTYDDIEYLKSIGFEKN